MSAPKHVTVLGAGLTGLTTAYRLSQTLPSSSKITLIDGSDRTGGWLKSDRQHVSFKNSKGKQREGDIVIESGPRSIRPRGSNGAPKMLQLIRDLELENVIIPVPKSHPSAKNRYILDTSKTPPKLARLSLNPFTSPLTLTTLLSALLEPIRHQRDPQIEDEFIDAFLRRRFGAGIAQIASAGMHGIYAASTTSLSAKAVLGKVYDMEQRCGSVIINWLTRSLAQRRKEREEEAEKWKGLGELGKVRDGWAHYGLQGGLGTLTKRLGERVRQSGVELHLGERVEGLEAGVRNGDVQVTTTSSTFSTSHLISALSPKTISSLIPALPFGPITTTSVGVVNLVYPLPPSAVHPDGFGYLIPRPLSRQPYGNPEGVLGVVFDDTSMPTLDGDLSGEITKLTIMIGGPFWSTYSPRLPVPPENELVQLAQTHLHKVFPVLRDVEPLIARGALHRDCIPTYTPGHYKRLKVLHSAISDSQWNGRLSLVGNGYGGVGVNDCVESAEVVVKALAGGRTLTGLETWA